MMRSYKFIVLGLLISMFNVFGLSAQEQVEHLPCLKAVYTLNDADVLLDCKPDESKSSKYNQFKWLVKAIDKNGRTGKEIKNCVVKKRGKYYLIPSEIYDSVGDKEVAVVYVQTTNDGKGLSTHYKVKVVNNQ